MSDTWILEKIACFILCGLATVYIYTCTCNWNPSALYIHFHDIVRMLCHDTCILFPYKSVGVCCFIDAVCDVLCLSFSPRQPDHFLAGCSDGSLRLYHTKRGMYKTSHSMLEVTTCSLFTTLLHFLAKPLLVWNTFVPYGAAVVHVQWVETCPGLFLVQDSLNTLYMWWVELIHWTKISYTVTVSDYFKKTSIYMTSC